MLRVNMARGHVHSPFHFVHARRYLHYPNPFHVGWDYAE